MSMSPLPPDIDAALERLSKFSPKRGMSACLIADLRGLIAACPPSADAVAATAAAAAAIVLARATSTGRSIQRPWGGA